MKSGLIAMFLAFALSASNVRANTYIGAGTLSCGAYLNKEEVVRSAVQLWVLGYVSGINAMSNVDFLEKFDGEGIGASVDKYCRENPLKKIYDASNDIGIQMMKMTK